MKKLILSLLIIITTTILSGCDGFKDRPSSDEDLEQYLDIDLENKPNLKGYYPNSGMSNSGFSNSFTTQISEELTGYSVEYTQDTSGNQKSAIENALLRKADYSFFKLESGSYEGVVGNQSLLNLKPFLEKFGQNLLEIIPENAWESVTLDGKIYAIPEISFSGYGMQDDALVWNMSHLEAVGITKVPETISEINYAFKKLDEMNSKNNINYSVLGLPGSQAMCNLLSSAFEVPDQFFEDENGVITPYIYHPNYQTYLNYLRSFVSNGYLFESWQGKLAIDVQTNLANGNHSVGYLSYWNVNSLVGAYSTLNKVTEEEARENFGYTLRVKGDGESGSIVQEEGRLRASESIGYYMAIPSYQYEIAGYVIDWMDQRIKEENYKIITGGLEGVHYETVSSDQAGNDGIIEITYDGETTYRKLLPQYNIDIEPNSMYATGVHPEVSRAYWPCREESYNCWEILYPLDDTVIENPIAIRPYLEGWSSISITARSWIITYEQKYANDKTDATAQSTFEYLQRVFKTRYWKEDVAAEVQTWYDNRFSKPEEEGSEEV